MPSEPASRLSFAKKGLFLLVMIPPTLKGVDDLIAGRGHHLQGLLALSMVAGAFGLYFLLFLGLRWLGSRLFQE